MPDDKSLAKLLADQYRNRLIALSTIPAFMGQKASDVQNPEWQKQSMGNLAEQLMPPKNPDDLAGWASQFATHTPNVGFAGLNIDKMGNRWQRVPAKVNEQGFTKEHRPYYTHPDWFEGLEPSKIAVETGNKMDDMQGLADLIRKMKMDALIKKAKGE